MNGQARTPLTEGSFFSSTARQAAHKSNAALHLSAVCHGKATKYPQTPPMSAAAAQEKGTPDKNAAQNGESVPSALSCESRKDAAAAQSCFAHGASSFSSSIMREVMFLISGAIFSSIFIRLVLSKIWLSGYYKFFFERKMSHCGAER